jgi:hypothetical protein
MLSVTVFIVVLSVIRLNVVVVNVAALPFEVWIELWHFY